MKEKIFYHPPMVRVANSGECTVHNLNHYFQIDIFWLSYHFYDLSQMTVLYQSQTWRLRRYNWQRILGHQLKRRVVSNKEILINPYHQNSSDDFCFCVLTAILLVLLFLTSDENCFCCCLPLLHYSNVKITFNHSHCMLLHPAAFA